MKLTISLFNIYIELSKMVLNLQYLSLLWFHFPFQLVVLDGRHSRLPNKQLKILHLIYIYIVDKITNIANSFMSKDFVDLPNYCAVS